MYSRVFSFGLLKIINVRGTLIYFSEATYARKCRKPTIPLILEDKYKPDGWLGLILGEKLYFRFCSDDEMTTNMPKLIKEIRKQVGARVNRQSDGADVKGKDSLQIQLSKQYFHSTSGF